MSTKTGYLGLIVGPMFSGKTTRIIELYYQYKNEGKNVLVVNYDADRRYHDSMLSTHDRVMIPCLFTDRLCDLVSAVNADYKSADVVLINEGQFFPDLYASVLSMIEVSKKTVHVCGLDGDFRREKFGEILDLLPISDSITKLTSKCANGCSFPALFSHRISNEKEKVLIGSDIYLPLCRHCYVIANVSVCIGEENTFSK
jgi:thymidine kinase